MTEHTTSNVPDFPALIDNTMRGDFLKCEKYFDWSFIQQLGPMRPSVHLHAGGAFAHGLEVARTSFYQEEKSKDESLRDGLAALMKFYGPVEFEPTKNGDKSLDNTIRAFDSYFQQYPIESDLIKPFRTESGKYMIEFTFSIPTEVMHPQTGQPILYGGRADMIGVLNDALFVTDEKTATSLGDQWAKQWDLESQFTGYIAAAKMYGYPVAGALIRGVGMLKTKITHQEALVYRADWEIERWWQQLHRDIQRMVQAWKDNYFGYALSKNSCQAFGGCTFKMLCQSQHPEQWLPIHFRRRVWNPLEKDMGEHLLDNPDFIKALTPPELDIPELLAMQAKTS